MTDVYQVRMPVFEGPLELLLALIEKRKLFINDIALADVADDYLKYLEHHQDFPLAETAQFVLVGSTLLLIKSKSLLPSLDLTEEEKESVEELERRLRALECYKRAGALLSQRFGESPMYAPVRSYTIQPSFSPDSNMHQQSLCDAIHSVLVHLPKPKLALAEATVRKVISLEEMMEHLTERINASMEISFREASRSAGHKVNVIVTFLAMLELVRQGVVRVEQEAQFGDIRMRSDRVAVPRYQ